MTCTSLNALTTHGPNRSVDSDDIDAQGTVLDHGRCLTVSWNKIGFAVSSDCEYR